MRAQSRTSPAGTRDPAPPAPAVACREGRPRAARGWLSIPQVRICQWVDVTSLIFSLRVLQRKKPRVYGRDGRGDENETGCWKPLIQNENVIIIRYERQQESKVSRHMRFTPSWKLALLQTGKIIIGDDWHRELGSLLEMPRYPAAAEPEFRRLGL
jgi:hypothetical protein